MVQCSFTKQITAYKPTSKLTSTSIMLILSHLILSVKSDTIGRLKEIVCSKIRFAYFSLWSVNLDCLDVSERMAEKISSYF